MILGLIIILFVLSSGSVLCAAMGKRRYEQILPITCTGVISVMFLCGIAEGLRYGIPLVLGLSLILWVCAGLVLWKRKQLKDFLRRIFTPGFFLWLAFILFALYYLPGMLFDRTDELSHWGDVVKGMFYFNQLSTAPAMESQFASYPPGLAVFEYLVTKVMSAAAHTDFQEWYVYLGWQLLVFSVMMPFTEKLRFRNPVTMAAIGLILFVSPSLIHIWIYSAVYADPALGVFLGAGMAMVAVNQEKDSRWYLLFLCCISVLLVLAKDVGLLFALMLWAAFSVDLLLCRRRSGWRKNLLSIGAVGVCIALPKLLWNGSILRNEVERNFSAPYDWPAFWQVLTGKDHTYRSDCWGNYWRAFVATGKEVGGITIPAVYLVMLLLFFLVCMVLLAVARKWERERFPSVVITGAVSWVNCLVYILGLGISYLFRFSEVEAMALESFNRYLNIICLCLWLYLVYTGVWIFSHRFQESRLFRIGVLCVALVMLPISNFKTCVTRSDVALSIESRAPYQHLFQLAREVVPAGERILVISDEAPLLEISYGLRPAYTDYYLDGHSPDSYDYLLLLTDRLPSGVEETLFDHVEAGSLYAKTEGRFIRCG